MNHFWWFTFEGENAPKSWKIHAQWLGAHSRLLYGLSDVPDLSIPLDLHADSLLSTAIISLGCTGLQKIARLTTEHRLPAIKMHKKRCVHDFFEMSNRWRPSEISWIWKSLAASEKPKSQCFLFWKTERERIFVWIFFEFSKMWNLLR